MSSRQLSNTQEPDLRAGFIQHSKKLSIWGLAQWLLICAALLLISIFCPVNDIILPMYKDIISGSATLAGVIITGYMGNSALEKFAEHKYKMTDLMSAANNRPDEEGGNG